jgi:hypothetical protein
LFKARSFNWRKHLDDATIARFQGPGRHEQVQFVALAASTLNLAMFLPVAILGRGVAMYSGCSRRSSPPGDGYSARH